MATGIGETLRKARTEYGIELEAVEQSTKIRVKYLRAMEDDAWELLPAPAYARGFLRTYASFLGLDADTLVREYSRYEQALGEGPPQAEALRQPGPAPERSRIRLSGWSIAGGVVAVLFALLIVLGVTGNSGTGGGNRGGGKGGSREQGQPSGASTTTSPTAAQPSSAPAALRLTATGTVWVCLVDDRGRPLVNGLTLGPGEVRGPYRSAGFKATFGNGSVQMEVDGRTVSVPQAAEPLGYEISRQGVRELTPSARPTCT
ncbi:MAG TPA: helix-turn-helix domain-containing protein [Solirubrobacterales bacterium]|jgi:cytoskeletal protein RodZ|nr:helix-turn-helix domain-containing protein [Solirubrobacterales bacterium]